MGWLYTCTLAKRKRKKENGVAGVETSACVHAASHIQLWRGLVVVVVVGCVWGVVVGTW
jgi:hypothetical protein